MGMDKDNKPDLALTENKSDTPQTNQSRRHFAKSVAGSGVVLSLASKSVMGANYWCTGSGGMSGNTSSHGPKVSCLACTPGYWATCPENWPLGCYPYMVCDSHGNTLHTPTKFSGIFGTCSAGYNKTMMWVMQNLNGQRDWHVCAAYLNAVKATQMGLVSAYTPQEIINMYQKGAPTKTFSSTYEGSMHNCNLPNTNNSVYLAENNPFCKLIASNGKETNTSNPACGH
jgi:hypothetical protein